MKVRKAVIVAAGLGTRMLPASKVIPKEILPVVDTPAVQLIAAEAVASGIEDIVVVLSPGRTLVLDHFKPAQDLEEHLMRKGKHEALRALRTSSFAARFHAAHQHQPLGLGHAVLQARDKIGDEPFGLFLPDDIVDAPRPCLRQLIEVAEERDAPVVALMRVSPSEVSKYGIVEAKTLGGRLYELTGMVEKPTPDKAPSDLAIIGRYVLTPEIFEFLAEGRTGAGGEIQLTDSLLGLAKRRKIYGYQFEGVRYDIGDRAGYVMAQVGFGLKHPEVADRLRAYLEQVLSPRSRMGQ
jgi:UTP--glucose-1-phosphate uridylyltransferase